MSTIPLQTGDRYYRAVVVRDGRGVLTTPDTLPAGIVYRNGAPLAVPVTTQAVSPGFVMDFQVPAALPGDDWSMLVSTQVGGRQIDRWIHLANAIFPGGSVHRGFITRDRRGAGVEPDLITAAIRRNGGSTSPAVPVTITPQGSPARGRHMLSFTVPGDWAPQDEVQALIEGVVQGKAVQRYLFAGQVVQPADVTITINRLRVMADEQTIIIQNTDERVVIASDEQALTVADIEQAVTVADTEQGIVE